MPLKIALYSDLHTEFDNRGPWIPPELDADVIVFAGDNVTSTGRLHEFAMAVENRQQRASRIIYVCGNHEFYGSKMRFGDRGYEKFRASIADLPRSQLLEKEALEILGVRIIGATMWTAVPKDLDSTFNDYRCIRMDKPPYMKLRPGDVLHWHQATVAYLEEALASDVPTIVTTHHPPSRVGLAVEKGDPWAADLDELIVARKPLAWLHGHVHQSHDNVVGKTRIVSNPRGYFPDDLNPEFEPEFVIDI